MTNRQFYEGRGMVQTTGRTTYWPRTVAITQVTIAVNTPVATATTAPAKPVNNKPYYRQKQRY